MGAAIFVLRDELWDGAGSITGGKDIEAPPTSRSFCKVNIKIDNFLPSGLRHISRQGHISVTMGLNSCNQTVEDSIVIKTIWFVGHVCKQPSIRVKSFDPKHTQRGKK